MSAYGTKRTSRSAYAMSALGGKADIGRTELLKTHLNLSGGPCGRLKIVRTPENSDLMTGKIRRPPA